MLPIPRAFGYLVPTIEKQHVLGVVFDSMTFPAQNPNKTIVTVMMGGENHQDLIQLPADELANIAMQHLGWIRVPSETASLNKWHQALPQCAVTPLSLQSVVLSLSSPTGTL